MRLKSKNRRQERTKWIIRLDILHVRKGEQKKNKKRR